MTNFGLPAAWRRVLPSLLLCILGALTAGLAGCDTQNVAELEEGVATDADVRARFGEPQQVWTAADLAQLPVPAAVTAPGARTYEYSRQPEGRANYMITMGPDGKMSALRQVLNAQNLAQVRPGMSMEQVRKMLGKPAKITPYALKQQTEYDWNYLDGSTRPMQFTVVLDRELKVLGSRSVDAESVNPAGGTK